MRRTTNPRDFDWQQLMRKAQTGDSEAFRELLNELLPYLRSFCAPRLDRCGLTDDVVQEILTTVHSHRHVYQPGRAFTPWLMAIARSKTIDSLRAYQRRKKIEVFEGSSVTFEQPVSYYDQFALSDQISRSLTQEKVADLRAEIQKLSPGMSEVVRLVKVQGFSVKETAAQMGITETLVKVRVHRAIQSIIGRLSKASND